MKDEISRCLAIMVCLLLLFSFAGAHSGHSHQESSSEGNDGSLVDEYPSSAVFLGALELVIGIFLVGLSYIHYSRRSD